MFAGRLFIHQWPVTHFGEPIQWVDTTRYLGITLYKRLPWSPHVDHFRKKTAQRRGLLHPILNGKSDLSFRKGILLYKELIRPWWGTLAPHGGPLFPPTSGGYRCYNPSVVALLLVHWYLSNKRIDEDRCVPLFADHISVRTASFNSKLLEVRNPKYCNLADTYADRRLNRRLTRKPKAEGASRPVDGQMD